MQEAYEESCREHGHEPGMTQLPPPDSADHAVRRRRRRQGVGRDRRVHPPRREDVRRLEPRRRDHRQHLARADGRGAAGDVTGAQDLQHRRGGRRWSRPAQPLMLMPLCGGIPPEIAWPYLEHAADVVQHARRGDLGWRRSPGSPTPAIPTPSSPRLRADGAVLVDEFIPPATVAAIRAEVDDARRGRGSGHAHREPGGAGVLRPVHQARVGAGRGVAHVRRRR